MGGCVLWITSVMRVSCGGICRLASTDVCAWGLDEILLGIGRGVRRNLSFGL